MQLGLAAFRNSLKIILVARRAYASGSLREARFVSTWLDPSLRPIQTDASWQSVFLRYESGIRSSMIFFILSLIFVVTALLPCAMFLRNQVFFQTANKSSELIQGAKAYPVSVLIPARNEQASIGAALESILKSEHPTIEVIVMDDDSEDNTREIVRTYSTRDSRVQLLRSAPLPPDWNGKQHACWQLAAAAKYPQLLFLDADVRITPDAISRCVAEQLYRRSPLVSGFPYQETKTWFEKTMIPLMHFVLLGYLPMDRMRQSGDVGFAAGCGQMFLADRAAYFSSLGHFCIRESRHDGIRLPRAFRAAGFQTDIFDATDIARCRMYENARSVWNGLSKNAIEGIGNPKLIVPFSILLLGSSVFPLFLLVYQLRSGVVDVVTWLCALAVVLGWIPRVLACFRFRQSWLGVFLHPMGIFLFVVIQWVALIRSLLGWKTAWRGRT